MKHVHILGICGTFMGGIAALAREAGYRVTGSDRDIYPPMSEQLAALGIGLTEGHAAAQLEPAPDMVIVGNVMSRGMPVVEALLNSSIPWLSGPDWLAQHVLRERWVIAVAGTHGKTTTSSLLAWILAASGHDAGYLIGGIPADFGRSARLGTAPWFVLEADEYDTAFFDKRPKFLLYHPRTLIINNIEFDHADIYPDLAAIMRQFHQLVRTVPGNGQLIVPAGDANVAEVLRSGCWTPCEYFGSGTGAPGQQDWLATCDPPGTFTVQHQGQLVGSCQWQLSGTHNAENALAALLAARHAGVDPVQALAAISSFSGVRRRLEHLGCFAGVDLYDDFAHHPTAIRRTLEGLRRRAPGRRVLAILELRSHSMRLGVHRDALGAAIGLAARSWMLRSADLDWNPEVVLADVSGLSFKDDTATIIRELADEVSAGDQVVIMSNGGFGNLRSELPRVLRERTGCHPR